MGRVIEIKRSHAHKWAAIEAFTTLHPSAVIKGLLVDDDVVSFAVVEQGRLYHIYTPPATRRAGYAFELLSWVKVNMLGPAGTIRTAVDKHNQGGVSLLMQAGFAFIGFTDIESEKYCLMEGGKKVPNLYSPYPRLQIALKDLSETLYVIEAVEVKLVR